MPLGPYMLGSAVVLVGDVYDERTRGVKRGPIGTAFAVRVASETLPETYYGYLVSCDHVTEGQEHIELQIPRVDDPTKYYPRVDAPGFKPPEGRLDLSLAEVDIPVNYTITALQLGFNLIEHLDPNQMLARDFHYVGYLAPIEPDGLVMARSGSIGRVGEMLADGNYEYATHVGDVRSYDGFSGSPCFIEFAYPVLVPKPTPFPQAPNEPIGRMSYAHLLCGMFTGHLDRRAPGGPVSRHGVGFILSSDEIWRVLMSDELRQRRREKDELGAPEDVRTRTSLADQEPPTQPENPEFERFEDLTRKLVNTPKPEKPTANGD
ncbi:MAG: hypothetical protein ACYDA6_00280 [Solirubrobacteraceae bacterium]